VYAPASNVIDVTESLKKTDNITKYFTDESHGDYSTLNFLPDTGFKPDKRIFLKILGYKLRFEVQK